MNASALYSAAIAGQSAVSYRAQVERAMGRYRRFADTYVPAGAIISAGLRDSRQAQDVAAQLLAIRSTIAAQDRRANAELKQRTGW